MEVVDGNGTTTSPLDYEGRAEEVEEFINSKTGVKGLVDSGIKRVPRFFILPPEIQPKTPPTKASTTLRLPVINIEGCSGHGTGQRAQIVDAIRAASERWGFFQMVNHGIPKRVMERLLESVRRFNEQPREERMKWYSQDSAKRIRYYSYGYSQSLKPANWRDSIALNFVDNPIDSEALPPVCREEIIEYMECVVRLKDTLSELLSEALGLSSDYLLHLECMRSRYLFCHYYPVCPEPQLTLGTTNHSDPYFLTILLTDKVDGLQVLHQNKWVDVPYLEGALVVNIGDLMQRIVKNQNLLVKNGKTPSIVISAP